MSTRHVAPPVSIAALAVALALGLTGCITQKMLISVNPDGSGNLVVSRVYSGEMVSTMQRSVEMMGRHRGSLPASPDVPADPLFNEKQLKAEGRLYGPGVEYVKGQKIERHGACGVVSVYKFKDVNQVHVPMGRGETMMMGQAAFGGGEEMEDMPVPEVDQDEAILFSLTKGDHSTLKIQMPSFLAEAAAKKGAPAEKPNTATPAGTPKAEAPPAAGKPAADAEGAGDEVEAPDQDEEAMDPEAQMELMEMGSPFGITGRDSQEEMARKTLKGLRISLAVEVKGTLLKSNAARKAPDAAQRFFVYDFDFDTIMASPKFSQIAKDQGMDPFSDPKEGLASFAALPGAEIETNREVVIEFK